MLFHDSISGREAVDYQHGQNLHHGGVAGLDNGRRHEAPPFADHAWKVSPKPRKIKLRKPWVELA